MAHLGDTLVEVGLDRIAADRLERGFPYEPERSIRRDDVHIVPGENERADDADSLIGGDSAGHTDDNVHFSVGNPQNIMVEANKAGLSG